MDARMTLEQFLKIEPAIALSWVNMKLRDEYRNLEDLCDGTGFSVEEITQKMHAYGYDYVEAANQFRPVETI